MALGPKAMGEAILQNLKAKTGKELSEWLEIVHKSGLEDKKSVMAFLKTEHALGHFQAQKIFEQFQGIDIYETPGHFIAELFHTSELKSFYSELESTIKALGDDVEVRPCKTYIPFYRHTQFATVSVGASGSVLLGLNLPDSFVHDRFKKTRTKASVRINFEAVLEPYQNIDADLKAVISQSYQLN